MRRVARPSPAPVLAAHIASHYSQTRAKRAQCSCGPHISVCGASWRGDSRALEQKMEGEEHAHRTMHHALMFRVSSLEARCQGHQAPQDRSPEAARWCQRDGERHPARLCTMSLNRSPQSFWSMQRALLSTQPCFRQRRPQSPWSCAEATSLRPGARAGTSREPAVDSHASRVWRVERYRYSVRSVHSV